MADSLDTVGGMRTNLAHGDDVATVLNAFAADVPLLDLATGIQDWTTETFGEAATWHELPTQEKARYPTTVVRYFNSLFMLGRRFPHTGQRALHLGAAMRIATNDAPRLLTACVHECRREGWSWTDVGDVVGLTRQGAQQRWEERFDRQPSRPAVPRVVDLPPLR